jgi:protein-disulfide isomerase
MAKRRAAAKRTRARRARAAPPPPSRPAGRSVALAFGIAIAAAVALIAIAVLSRSDDSPAPTTASPLDLSGIPQDGTILGAPDANVTLIEYADLQCPACRAYTETVVPGVVGSYVRPGDVKLEFRGMAFIGEDSEKALRYVLAAGLQDRLWQLQDGLYRNQGGENSGWVTEELVRTLSEAIPGLDADQVIADADSDEVTAQLAQVAVLPETAQVRGTPTVFVKVGDGEPQMLEAGSGSEEVAAALDDALGR